MDKSLRLQVILGAVDRLLKPLEGNARASGRLSRALKAQQDRLRSLQAAQRDIAQRRDLEQSILATTLKAAEQKRTVDQLAAAWNKAARPNATLTRNYNNAREALDRLNRETDEHRGQLRAVETRLQAAGYETADLARHETRLAAEIADTNMQIRLQKRELTDLAERQRRVQRANAAGERTEAFAGRAAAGGATALTAGAGLAAPIVLATKASIDFEQAMAAVKKVVDFPTPESFQQMNRDILDLSGRIPVASGELAALVAQGARAGVAREDLLAFAEAAAKMGVAFDVSSEEAGQMMARWQAALGMSHGEVIELANQVNHLTNTYGGNAAAVSEMITRVGPLADVAGASGSVLAALAQVMNRVGVESEVGATGIKNMLLGLTKGTAATKTQQKAFAALGLDAGVVAKQMQTDAEGAIIGVLSAIAKLPKEQQLATLGQLFGTESVATIAPMLSQLDLVEQNLKAVGDASTYAHSMQKEFAGTVDNTAGRMVQAANKAKRMATILGDRFKPYVDLATKAAGNLSDSVVNFADRHPQITGAVLAIIAVVAGLLLVFGGLALAAAAVLAPFALLQFAWAGALPALLKMGGLLKFVTMGLWGVARAAGGAALPFWPIILAATALAGIAWLIWRNWGAIATFFTNVWNRVVEITRAAIPMIGQAILSFSPVGLFVRVFAALWPHLQTLGARFVEIGKDLIAGLIRGVLSKLGALKSTITDTASKAASWFREKMGIRSPSRLFAEYGGHTMAGLALGIERSRQDPLDALGKVGAAMAGALTLGATPALAGGGDGLGAGAGRVGDVYEIHVHAAPGQDVQTLADAVIARIRTIQGAKARSRFGDDAE